MFSKNKINALAVALLILTSICAILIPWYIYQGQYFVFGNVSWLLISAERLLQGQSLIEHIYETNPPLSIIIYIPHVIISHISGLPLPIASFYGTSIMIMASLALSATIIKRFGFLNASEKLLIIMFGLTALTISTGIHISEREHMIAIWLLPFILCQFAITEKIKIPKHILIPTLTLGSLFILVKPHYGIIPSVLFIIRMFKQKKTLTLIKDIDFIILASLTTIYIGVIWIFFKDYALIILPDVINLYATPAPDWQVLATVKDHLSIIIPLILLELVMTDINGPKKRLLNLFQTGMLLGLIPYIVQYKGFHNHLIPVYAFFIISLGLSIAFRLEKLPQKTILRFAYPSLALICVCAFTLAFTPQTSKILNHKDVPELSVTKFLNENCSYPCTYFVFHGDIEIFNPINAYTGITHASRFPTFWFIPKIFADLKNNNQEIRQEALRLQNKYTAFFAQDLEYYKPEIMLIAKELPLGDNGNFYFLEFFETNDNVKNIIEKKYTQDGEFTLNYADYFKGTMLGETPKYYTYTIYRRNNGNQSDLGLNTNTHDPI